MSLTFGNSYFVLGNLEFPATFLKINGITFLCVLSVLRIQYQDAKNTAILGVLRIQNQDVKNTAVLGVLRIRYQDVKNTAVLGIPSVLRIALPYWAS